MVGRIISALTIVLFYSACSDGCPSRDGTGPGTSTTPQAIARFQNYEFDTYPQTSFHTSKVCDVVAARIDYKPPLPAGTEAHIKLEEFGGATAELGQVPPPAGPLKELDQKAAADGSLGFGFHFLGGKPPGSVDIVIEIAGRPTQRITVRIIV